MPPGFNQRNPETALLHTDTNAFPQTQLRTYLSLELPAELAGNGQLTLALTVEGLNLNPLQLVIK